MDLVRPYETELNKRLREKSPLIQIVIGPRQIGKTTAANRVYNAWQGPKLMISADSPTPQSPDWIRWNWQKALDKGPNCLFIIDEVQKIKGWSEVVKILFDEERGKGNLKILFLGSSSLFLRKGMDESLTGRFEQISASHWTFKECKEYFGWKVDDYLKFGGYPGAAQFISDEDRWRNYILNSIVEPILGRDIAGQQQIANPSLFRQCFELAVNYPAQMLSYNSILGRLHEKGNTATVKHYLELFEKAFLLKCLQKYSGSELKVKASSPKIVVLNSALTNAYQSPSRLESDRRWYGFMFESMVGAHLAQIPNSQMYYWRMGGFEVDYVIKTPEGIKAIEIKSGYEKSSMGLEKFSKIYPSAKCILMNRDDCMNFMEGKTDFFSL